MANGFNQNKVFSLIRTGALLAPIASRVLESQGDLPNALRGIMVDYTGFDYVGGNFDPKRLLRGWGPWVASKVMTQAIPKIVSGITKMFS